MAERRMASVVMAVIAGSMLVACERNEAVLVSEGGAPSANENSSVENSATFGVGDRVGLGDWEFTLHGVTDPFDNGSAFGSPRAGQRWVAVDVEVFNVGAEPRSIAPVVCFDLQDELNRTFDQEFLVETDTGRPDGEISPGSSRRGTVVWELPTDAAALRLNVKCDVFSRGSATFELG